MAIATGGCNVIGRHNFQAQKIEAKILSLVSVHSHAHHLSLLLYYCRFVQYGDTKLRKHFNAIMEVFYCFTVAIGLPGDASDYNEDKRSAVSARMQNKVFVE